MSKSEPSHWYVATLVVQSKVANESGPATCQEQIRVIRAPNADAAYEKAISLGKEEEHSYENVYGETVSWEFAGLEDLEELEGAIRDGTEIRYRFFRHKNPSSLACPKDELSVYLASKDAQERGYRIHTEQEPFD